MGLEGSQRSCPRGGGGLARLLLLIVLVAQGVSGFRLVGSSDLGQSKNPDFHRALGPNEDGGGPSPPCDGYCDSSTYRNSVACTGACAGYCDGASYSNSVACQGCCAGYCDSASYRMDVGCQGCCPDCARRAPASAHESARGPASRPPRRTPPRTPPARIPPPPPPPPSPPPRFAFGADCDSSSYATATACIGCKSGYCDSSGYASGCTGTCGDFCDESSYKDSPACQVTLLALATAARGGWRASRILLTGQPQQWPRERAAGAHGGAERPLERRQCQDRQEVRARPWRRDLERRREQARPAGGPGSRRGQGQGQGFGTRERPSFATTTSPGRRRRERANSFMTAPVDGFASVAPESW